MKKQEVDRLYKFSDATLVTKGLEKVAFMERDAAKYAEYGIEGTDFTALKNSLNAFADISTDIEALGDQMNVTNQKEAKAEELRVAIRTLMSRVVLKFAVESAQYKKFGTDTLSRQTDSDLFITAKRVVRVGNELLPALADNGLTIAQLDNITDLNNTFSELLVDQKIEIGDRDIKQEDRVEAGNEIYKLLVKYTTLGQSIWVSSDVAKFNDYIIYNTISGEPEDPPTDTPKE